MLFVLADYDSKERAILYPEWLSSGCVVPGILAPQQAGRSASDPPRCLEDSGARYHPLPRDRVLSRSSPLNHPKTIVDDLF